MKMKSILLFVWVFIIIYIIYYSIYNNQLEGFTPKIRSLYRPHIRRFRIHAETFINKYSLDYFTKILAKIGIY